MWVFPLIYCHTLVADDDWSWMIRYAAVQGLMRICRASIKDDLKMGMRNTAWQFVMKLRSIEKDDRVHEALKIGQVYFHNLI